MSNKKNVSKPDEERQLTDEEIEKYIQSMGLKGLYGWTKESQEAYVRARLKARANQKKEDRYSHWDLF